jgi:hypothetical protein
MTGGQQEQENARETLRMALEARFGQLPASARQRLDDLSSERVRELLIAFAQGRSLTEMGLES